MSFYNKAIFSDGYFYFIFNWGLVAISSERPMLKTLVLMFRIPALHVEIELFLHIIFSKIAQVLSDSAESVNIIS